MDIHIREWLLHCCAGNALYVQAERPRLAVRNRDADGHDLLNVHHLLHLLHVAVCRQQEIRDGNLRISDQSLEMWQS